MCYELCDNFFFYLLLIVQKSEINVIFNSIDILFLQNNNLYVQFFYTDMRFLRTRELARTGEAMTNFININFSKISFLKPVTRNPQLETLKIYFNFCKYIFTTLSNPKYKDSETKECPIETSNKLGMFSLKNLILSKLKS